LGTARPLVERGDIDPVEAFWMTHFHSPMPWSAAVSTPSFSFGDWYSLRAPIKLSDVELSAGYNPQLTDPLLAPQLFEPVTGIRTYNTPQWVAATAGAGGGGGTYNATYNTTVTTANIVYATPTVTWQVIADEESEYLLRPPTATGPA